VRLFVCVPENEFSSTITILAFAIIHSLVILRSFLTSPYQVRELLKNIGKAEGLVDEGIKNMNRDTIQEGVDFCDGFGYNSDIIEAGRLMMARITKAEAMCTGGIENMNEGQLKEALQECDAFGCNTDIVGK
jgi:hypothetical protein